MQPVQLIKSTKSTNLTTLAISLVLATTLLPACGNKPTEEKASEPAKTETPATQTTDNKPEAIQSNEQAQTTQQSSTDGSSNPAEHLATVTLNVPAKIIKATMNTDITADQKDCIGKIDIDSQFDLAKGYFEKEFTPAELQKLSNFYAQPDVAAVIDYGTDQALTMMGIPVESSAQLNMEGMQKVTEFAATPVGQKYTEFNMSEADGTLNATINEFIETQMTKCGLDMS